MGIFRKKKKEEWNFEITPGVFMGRPKAPGKDKAIWNCLPKGILVFLVVFGSLGGFLSAFQVAYRQEFVGTVLFFTAMYFSGLFAFRKGWHKDLGYIVYFVFYVMGIYIYRSYVNSGFAVILNEVRQQGEVYFGLNAGNEFSESMEDREMAATMAVLFIGMFEIILLNIFISNYMSLKFTAFVTLPIFVFPMYFQQEPGMGYVICLLGGLMGIYVLKNSGHFRDVEKRHEYVREKKTKVPVLCYTQRNSVYCGVLVMIAVCTLLVGVGSAFFGAQDFRRYYKENVYKEATRDGISGFLMMGWRIFYPGGYSWSGMSGGDLRNVAAVRPDETTHLVLRFAPYAKGRLYLKGYTAKDYIGSRWTQDIETQRRYVVNFGGLETSSLVDKRYRADKLLEEYEEGNPHSAKGKMEILVENADKSYEYVPYYTLSEVERDVEDYESRYNLEYFPNIGYQIEMSRDKEADTYLTVPFGCQLAVDNFLYEADTYPGDDKAVDKVVTYLKEAYEYSYAPGRVPRNRDAVEYFLTDNRKGVCMHFASAATLIFRRLGIPARYVEGYAIDDSNVAAGKVCDDLAYEDYYDGYSELGEKVVKEVEVPGGNAHAWVEIYQEGKGWIVVDPTPMSFEPASQGGVLDSLQEIWTDPSNASAVGWISRFNLEFLKSNAIQAMVSFMVIVAVLFWIIRGIWKQVVRYQSWHTKDLQKNMLWYYRDMCRYVAKRDSQFAKLSVPSEQLSYLAEIYQEKKEKELDMIEIQRIFGEICFSPKKPRREDYEMVMETLKQLRKCQ